MIYADNAATTVLDIDAFEAAKPFLLENYGNASQPYFFAKSAKKAIQEARESIASCIGASFEEIYFTSGGTESDNWAIKGIMFSDTKRRITVTSQIEHHAVLNACVALERQGYPVIYLPVSRDGIIEPKTLESDISYKVKLVSVMFANNEIGSIEPISELAGIAHTYGALFHTDAVQAVGHIPVNVKNLGVDMLSASAHKFNGMKGSGFLYIRKGTKITPYIDGGAQEMGMRAGTENIAAIVAMAVALKKNCTRMSEQSKKLIMTEQRFLADLQEHYIDFIRNGSDKHLPGIVSISVKDADGEMLLHRLDLKGICVSTGSACDSSRTHVSHVIRAISVPEEYAKGTVRITFGSNNEVADADKIAYAIAEILKKR